MSDTESSSESANEETPMGPNNVDWRNMENIRVICRFRPINSREIREEESGQLVDSPPEITNNGTCVEIHRDTSNRIRADPLEFYLDRILPSNTSQQNLYVNVGKPMVEACLEGYNTTIFAYGQTGSGKTYTMFGPENQKLQSNNDELGCVQRCISYMFTELQQRLNNKSVTEWKVLLHFVQIYREKLLDLLEPNKGIPLKIRCDPQKDLPYVPNLKSVDVSEMLEVMKLLAIANSNRITDKTDMNAVSSRSHMIMTLNIEQTLKDGTVKKSKLNFADLAGSETYQKALRGHKHRRAADKKKMEELKKINLSLTNLTTCINYLSKGRKASYRSSKLTYYLMDSLGGNSKTTLLVSASPHIFNRTETISTLRFAKTAKSVKNKAKVNKELSKAQLEKLVKKLQRENKRLKAKLALMEAELLENGIGLATNPERQNLRRSRSKSMHAISTKEILKVTYEYCKSHKKVLSQSTLDQISYAGNDSNERNESVYNKLKLELKSLQDAFAEQEIEVSILNDKLQKKRIEVSILSELAEELQSSTLQEEDISNMKQQLKTQRKTFISEKRVLEQKLNESQFDIQQCESIMDEMNQSNEQLVAEMEKANDILSKCFAAVIPLNKEQMNEIELKDTDANDTFTGQKDDVNGDGKMNHKRKSSRKRNCKISSKLHDRLSMFGGGSSLNRRKSSAINIKAKKSKKRKPKPKNKNIIFQTERLTRYLNEAMKKMSTQKEIYAKEIKHEMKKNDSYIKVINNLRRDIKETKAKMDQNLTAKNNEIERLKQEALDLKVKKHIRQLTEDMVDNEDFGVFVFDEYLSNISNKYFTSVKQEVVDLKVQQETKQLTKDTVDSKGLGLFQFDEFFINIGNKYFSTVKQFEYFGKI